MANFARCPRCQKPSKTPAKGKDRFYCHECRMEFEAIEDGTVTYGDPARIAERNDQRKRNHRQHRPRGGFGQ